MGFLFTGVFWGGLLVLLGLSVLLKAYFHLDIPVLRTVFGFLLILLGVQVLSGRPWLDRWTGAEGQTGALQHPEAGRNYLILFSKGVLDLGRWSAPGKDLDLKLDTVFGHSELRLNPAVPTELSVDAAFAGARLPDGTVLSFGRHVYRSKAWAEGKPVLRLRASVVFGALDVKD